MFLRTITKTYDIFLTLLGVTWVSILSVSVLVRWNWNCDLKFIVTLNKMVRFEQDLISLGVIKIEGETLIICYE